MVTVEGLNLPDKLNKVQQAMVEFSGTQCGFCTPGFVNSLSSYALTCGSSGSVYEANLEGAISAIDGNICRCTGYKSIERAAADIVKQLTLKPFGQKLQWLVNNEFIPEYFLGVEERLRAMEPKNHENGAVAIGGGTDLYVQKHDDMHAMDLNYLFDKDNEDRIVFEGQTCIIKSGVTVSELMSQKTLLAAIPNWYEFMKLVSSTPIRNIGTVAGNLANGSPIGDMTIIMLALKARISLTNKEDVTRELALKDFYLGYKTLDMKTDEIISKIAFDVPIASWLNFEKVCKRQYLDIASVNTAINVYTMGETIIEAHCSIGGVGPTPKYLTQTSAFLTGKELSPEMLKEAVQVLQGELAPISDARGTVEYKRLLARQLFFAHFLALYPETFKMQELV